MVVPRIILSITVIELYHRSLRLLSLKSIAHDLNLNIFINAFISSLTLAILDILNLYQIAFRSISSSNIVLILVLLK